MVKQLKQTPDYTVAYRVAARLFDSAFAACERVPEVDRQLLLREIGSRIIATLRPDPPVKPIRVLGIEIKQEEVRDSAKSGR